MTTRHPLAELIDSVKAANGWSDPQLVANARAKGYVLSKSNISRYRQPVVSIKGDVIQALAAGLRVSPAQVAVAAVQSMGIQLPAYDSITPEQAVRLDIGLSTRDKGALLALLAQMRGTDMRTSSHGVKSPDQFDRWRRGGKVEHGDESA